MQDLKDIFSALKELLSLYQPPLLPRQNNDSYYDLWSIKDVAIAGRKRKEVFFTGVIVQKSYVGFYYMPIYTDTALKSVFEHELLGLLKGKSCFHIKKLDQKLIQQIVKALKIGFEKYKANGWV